MIIFVPVIVSIRDFNVIVIRNFVSNLSEAHTLLTEEVLHVSYPYECVLQRFSPLYMISKTNKRIKKKLPGISSYRPIWILFYFAVSYCISPIFTAYLLHESRSVHGYPRYVTLFASSSSFIFQDKELIVD